MEIVDCIHQVDGVNANVYLLIVGEELTIVDTGLPKNAEKILGYVRKIDRQPSDIRKILLTHCHIDHVGSAYELKRISGAQVGVHQDDADFVSGKKNMPAPKGAVGIALRAVSPFFKFRPVKPDITLHDNEKVGGLTVIHTPGHTPGSISLYEPVRRVLFVGDAVRFVEGNINGPPERFTLDTRQAIKSIEKISQLDFNVMLSGHGDPLRPNASERVREFCTSLK